MSALPSTVLRIRNVLAARFEALADDELDLLCEQATIRPFVKDQKLFDEAENTACLCLVLEGEVKLSKTDDRGKEHILHVVCPSNLLDASVLFGKGEAVMAASALCKGSLLCLGKEIMLRIMSRNGRFAMRLMELVVMRQRLFINKIIGSQGKISSRRRIAGWLLHRARMKNTPIVEMRMTREIWAGVLGITRESLCRQLHCFVRAGDIRLERGRIFLLNEDALRQSME